MRFLRWNSVKFGRLVINTLLTRLSGRSIGRIFHRGKSKRFTKIGKKNYLITYFERYRDDNETTFRHCLFNNFERTGWKANVQTVFKTYHAQRRQWFTLWRHLSWIVYRAYLIGLFCKPEIMKVFYWKSILFTTIVLHVMLSGWFCCYSARAVLRLQFWSCHPRLENGWDEVLKKPAEIIVAEVGFALTQSSMSRCGQSVSGHVIRVKRFVCPGKITEWEVVEKRVTRINRKKFPRINYH